ncbi:MAG: thioesterase family protein [Parasphingorhabdus sp.]|uniref:acyl-CoA thioesterase n=1 Tax=Parasphingorhabdus sp. TaxID=2709688 RepID=UPI0030012980
MNLENQDPRTGFRLITPVRVRYSEADMQGIVFNANYLALADVGVTEYFRALVGATGNEDSLGKFNELFGGDNWVRHADVEFLAPAKADDLIDVCIRISRFGRTSYSALVHIVREDELLNVMRLTYVWFDSATKQVAPLAKSFVAAVTEFEMIEPERAVISA